MSKIPVKALKDLANTYGLDRVVVFATNANTQFVSTYGRTVEECSEAADFGNLLKDALGWPASLHQQPSRVKRLQKRIEELEQQLHNAFELRTASNLCRYCGKQGFSTS